MRKASTKDILENHHLALLTHDGKLQPCSGMLLETKLPAPAKTVQLSASQPDMKIFERSHALDLDQENLVLG